MTAAPTKPATQELQFDRHPSNRCGVTMSASVEGNIIADVMGEKPGVTIVKYPAMIRIDGEKTLEFDLNEIAEALGVEPGDFGPYQFEIEMSTHYGRMVRLEDKVLFFANPEDAAEYLGIGAEQTAAG
ncbi:MAG: MmoB/DmpM family protein [Herpetosiphon sp.]